MPNSPKYQAVIFDLFGTLVDSFSQKKHEQVLAKMAQAVGAREEDFAGMWLGETVDMRFTGEIDTIASNVEYVCRALKIKSDFKQISMAEKIYFDFVQKCLKPRADALRILANLQSTGYKLGLVSDCSSEVPLLWPETPFSFLFDAVVFSCLMGLRKPDPRMYLFICHQLKVKPQDCLYVGDGGSNELTGAAAVGMTPVMLQAPDGHDEIYRLQIQEWHGPTISLLKNILKIVNGL
jgi:putative hydrolase of the HAD superfamily